MPGQKGAYNVAKAKAWVAENIKKKGTKGPLSEQKLKQEIAKLKEEVRAKSLKNDLAEQQLLSAEEVNQKVSELCLRIKHRLEQIPDEMEMSFPVETRADNKRELENKIENILREMSQWEL